MKIVWNQDALRVLRRETNVFCIEPDRIIWTYDGFNANDYSPWHYCYTNEELLSTVREIVTERYNDYKEYDCLDLFPDEYLPFIA